MHAGWLYRLRFIKRHLLMLLLAFGWLLIQSQVALASHDCSVSVQGEHMMVQHMDHRMMMSDSAPHMDMMKTPLCEKHCVPDLAQKDTDNASLVALPVSLTLVAAEPVCSPVAHDGWSLTPPAIGPPATIRFCRFRE
ncbi:DUF2946 domain-containing protein [Kosakonia sacchari]|uniref:DUF2946 domain-containing protein n=1 Tax=Kosakonia sacchari TaxID=1158459 RepID=UPI0013626B98|nr:DUF2946 domain-containing protein [Kosakonia sacchari]QHM97232.1 DUF2946 domain-containing protein [Kosakonia sacchari]